MAGPYHQYKSGIGVTSAYQVSAVPYLSGTFQVPTNNAAGGATSVSFPAVTSFIAVQNDGSVTIRLGCSATGVSGSGGHWWPIKPGDSFAADWKVTDLYLISNNGNLGSASVAAGLTSIRRSEIFNNWSGSFYSGGIG